MECAGHRPQQGRSPPPRPSAPPGAAAVNGDSQQEMSASFKSFQQLHDKAFSTVKKGLSADSDGDLTAAEHYYTEGFGLLDQILDVDCENLPGASASEKDQAKLMQQKMNKTKWQITYRLEALRGDTNRHASGAALTELPWDQSSSGVRLPSYDEAVSAPSSISASSLMSDATLGDSIMTAHYPNLSENNRVSTQGTELFSIPEGVQIFHITGEGYVSAPSYPSSLHVIQMEEPRDVETDPDLNRETPPAYLQVGEWFYPLIPGASPVLHTSYGAYIFPDLSAAGTGIGSAVGVMLPETLSRAERTVLEDILHSFSAVQDQQSQIEPQDLVMPSAPALEREEATAPKTVAREEAEGEVGSEGEPDTSTSGKISRGITVASTWISWGVGKGAEKAGDLIVKGSQKLREKLKQETQPRPVNPKVQKGVMYARKATHAAVSVSGFIVTKLGEATMSLARQAAPHIRKKGEEILPKSFKSKDNNGKSTMDGVIEVAASGLHGFGTVYMSLESAAKALAKGLANETVATVNHKYGPHAGKVTENAVYSVGNLAMTGYNVEHLGVKAIAKRAAKDTGAALITDINESKKAAPKGGASGSSVDMPSSSKSSLDSGHTSTALEKKPL